MCGRETNKIVMIFFCLVQVLTFGSNIFRSKLFSTLPLLVLAASRRKRARSTRANVGLSNIDGVRLGGPEFVSDVTSISVLLIFNVFFFGKRSLLYRLSNLTRSIVLGANEQKCQWRRNEKHKF